MDPHQMPHAQSRQAPQNLMNRLLGAMSMVTMLMTIPQVWVIWVNHEAAGVSLLSWGAYFVSAVLWLVHGLQENDKNIYLACVGWLALDLAVIVGVWIYG